ncbi:hypothetical protein CBL_07539 [Carabus blaptoides fortunei]
MVNFFRDRLYKFPIGVCWGESNGFSVTGPSKTVELLAQGSGIDQWSPRGRMPTVPIPQEIRNTWHFFRSARKKNSSTCVFIENANSTVHRRCAQHARPGRKYIYDCDSLDDIYDVLSGVAIFSYGYKSTTPTLQEVDEVGMKKGEIQSQLR